MLTNKLEETNIACYDDYHITIDCNIVTIYWHYRELYKTESFHFLNI